MKTIKRQISLPLLNIGLLVAFVFSINPSRALAQVVTVEDHKDRLRVEVDGKLFTEYVYANCANPYLYPVIGPYGIGMTRNFPMKRVSGEAHDHPHHTSIWFAHDGINGVDFWRSTKPGHGTVVHESTLRTQSGDHGLLQATNRWVGPDGAVVCRDQRTIGFRVFPGGRAIDWEITLQATEGDVRIQDTEEGTMGIRTHPNLRLENGDGVTSANGQAINSEGVTGKDVWGKRAAWIDYWGTLNGKVVGIALYNHPRNPRHPTWWHARPYGLFTANPFGIHDFEGEPAGSGDMTIRSGDSVTLRYRIVLHAGSPTEAGIAEQYSAYAND